MFSKPFETLDPTPHDFTTAQVIYRIVLDRVGALLGPSATAPARKDAAIALTSVVEGLAHTELSGRLGHDRSSIERRWNVTVESVLSGLAQMVGVSDNIASKGT